MTFQYGSLEEKSGVNRVVKSIIIWVVQIACVILLAFLLVHFGLERTSMLGDSMKETLSNGETLVVNKFAYKFTSPKRNDVIAFRQNDSEHAFLNVKRVIGLPGETVQIKKGVIYINNKKMKERVNVDLAESAGLAKTAIKLDEGEYFCLGDNRNNSEDSRFSTIGNIVENEIVGKVFFDVDKKQFVSSMNAVKESLLGDKEK